MTVEGNLTTMVSGKNLEMQNVRVWETPKQSIGKFFRLGFDDTNTPYATTRRAFRQCAAGVLRLHAAETLFRPKKEEWHALVLRQPTGKECAWFYRDESRCRAVYAEWAGHGDPEGFDFSFETFVRNSPEVELAEVLKKAKPLVVQIPADASPETMAALVKLTAADLNRQ